MKINLKEKELTFFPLSLDKNTVCIHGRTKKDLITLPEEWNEIVDLTSISVHLTPIGANQNLVVKRTQELEIHLQTNGLPVDCYYLILGQVLDTAS